MALLFRSFISNLNSNRLGLSVFSLLTLATVIILMTSNNIGAPPQQNNQVTVHTKLSQSKIVSNDPNTVYLEVNIAPPVINSDQHSSPPSDIIVVLDSSGSMAGANKLTYAKAAVRELLAGMNQQDRFALITFANQATVHAQLTAVDADRRERLNTTVNSIQAGGGTNMGEGLSAAVKLLNNKVIGRARKIIMLSDGHANQGITSLSGLNQIVHQATQQEAVLSTIGLGLDFNETLMSSLADFGMGNYDYLENLAGLGQIFSRSLNATRHIFASNSNLILNLNQGVQLIDAAGYPFTNNKGNIHIKTGQLLNNDQKNFVLTLNVKSKNTGVLPLGEMNLHYQVKGESLQQPVSTEQLTLSVVEQDRKQEALASIDQAIYKKSWLKNNLGRMQKKLSYWLREGNKAKADQVLNEYRKDLDKAEEQAAVPLQTDELDRKLSEMESSVAEVFDGSRQEQEIKRKRTAKSLFSGSIKQQRIIKKQ